MLVCAVARVAFVSRPGFDVYHFLGLLVITGEKAPSVAGIQSNI